jgi:uncharacterized protein (TIGR03083 family)
VTTPAYSELVAALRSEGEGILAAGRLGLDAPVETCPGWTVTDLLRHVTRVYARVEHVVAHRVLQEPDDKPAIPDGDPVELLDTVLDELVGALREADSDTPVWVWADGAEPTATFWARRMAHESSVHRFDAQMAHGMAQPVDAELAADGLDELIDVIAPSIYSRREVEGPAGTAQLDSSDNGAWCLGLGTGGLRRLDVASKPDVTVRGTSSALLLAAYGRVPWSSLTVEGDLGLLDEWSTAMRF